MLSDLYDWWTNNIDDVYPVSVSRIFHAKTQREDAKPQRKMFNLFFAPLRPLWPWRETVSTSCRLPTPVHRRPDVRACRAHECVPPCRAVRAGNRALLV